MRRADGPCNHAHQRGWISCPRSGDQHCKRRAGPSGSRARPALDALTSVRVFAAAYVAVFHRAKPHSSVGALALALRLGLENVGATAGLRLAAVVAFGMAVFPALLAWREPALVREVWTLIRRRGR
jgi:hypothetical protein